MKDSYEKELGKIFDVLEEKRLVKGVELMEKLIVRLFKRDIVTFDSVKKVHCLVKAVEKSESKKAVYLQNRRLWGDKYEEVLSRDIGVFFARLLLEDCRIRENIGSVDMAMLFRYLGNRLYDDVDYNYHAAVLKMQNAAVQNGRLIYLKKDDGRDERYSMCMVYEHQIRDETVCFIEHGLTSDLWSNGSSIYANFCDVPAAYVKFQPISARKEIIRDRHIVTVTEDGSVFAYDSEGRLYVKKKYERERIVPGLTKDSKFEIMDSGGSILLHRRFLKEGIGEMPVLMRLVWEKGEMKVKEYLLSKKNQKEYVWARLVSRITDSDDNNLLSVLKSNATPLNVPEPFTPKAVAEALEKLTVYWPYGTNVELDSVCAFVRELSGNLMIDSEFLTYYLYSYLEFVETMLQTSVWEPERIYRRAIDVGERGYIDYQEKLSFVLNRCTKKKHWTEPEGCVGFFEYKNGELVKDLVTFSDAEVTLDSFKKNTNSEKLSCELRFDRYKNKYVVTGKKDKLVENVLRKTLGTSKEFEFNAKVKEQGDTRWEMLHDIEFYEALKKGKS